MLNLHQIKPVWFYLVHSLSLCVNYLRSLWVQIIMIMSLYFFISYIWSRISVRPHHRRGHDRHVGDLGRPANRRRQDPNAGTNITKLFFAKNDGSLYSKARFWCMMWGVWLSLHHHLHPVGWGENPWGLVNPVKAIRVGVGGYKKGCTTMLNGHCFKLIK